MQSWRRDPLAPPLLRDKPPVHDYGSCSGPFGWLRPLGNLLHSLIPFARGRFNLGCLRGAALMANTPRVDEVLRCVLVMCKLTST